MPWLSTRSTHINIYTSRGERDYSTHTIYTHIGRVEWSVPANAQATCSRGGGAWSSSGCQSKHQLQIVCERSAQDPGADTSVGAQLLIRSHLRDLGALGSRGLWGDSGLLSPFCIQHYTQEPRLVGDSRDFALLSPFLCIQYYTVIKVTTTTVPCHVLPAAGLSPVPERWPGRRLWRGAAGGTGRRRRRCSSRRRSRVRKARRKRAWEQLRRRCHLRAGHVPVQRPQLQRLPALHHRPHPLLSDGKCTMLARVCVAVLRGCLHATYSICFNVMGRSPRAAQLNLLKSPCYSSFPGGSQAADPAPNPNFPHS